jgi:hypothetical protein
VAVTADVRRFLVPEFVKTPINSVGKTGWGIAADAFVPVLPVKWAQSFGALSLNGEYAYGYGIADLYTGLNGGVSQPPVQPGTITATNPGTQLANTDPSLVVMGADGQPHAINWQSGLVGLQYYFPKLNNRLWVSTNYSHIESNNAFLHAGLSTANPTFGDKTKARKSEDWADVNLFGDVTTAVRLGVEYAWFDDHYADGVDAVNHRFQFSAFYLF